MLNNRNVNLIIKDRLFRYMVTKQPRLDGVVDHGERFIDADIIEDGKIVNQKAFEKVLEKLIRDKRWKNKTLSFCVPDTFLTIREVFVPKQLVKEEIKSYIQMEMAESIRLPYANAIFDFEIIGEENEQHKVLLFAYPKERMDEYLKSFERVGLKAKVADLSSLSIYRLYYKLDLAHTKEHLLLVQWCKDATVLTAFDQHKPVFTRHLRSPLDRQTWSWSPTENELKWTGDEEELNQMIEDQLGTIERFMNFYQYSIKDGEEQISKILLVGDFPELERIQQLMTEQYGVVVETMDKLEKRLKYPSKYFDVLGLSVKNRNK